MVNCMDLMYQSTRNNEEKVTASKAILQGLASDGGLFVPTAIPRLALDITELARLNYQQTALEVMKLFFTDFTENELKECIEKAYDDKFDTKEIAPVREVDGVYYLELFHGATIAFKDMALSILPHLLTTAAKKNNVTDEIVILTATSGDTGKAALAGFSDVPGTKIIVFYPKNGVSKVQEKQMITQEGENTYVIGITGNFDDAQNGVKEIFNNKELAYKMKENGYQFSSANSINIGRLIPQVAYYVYAYTRLMNQGAITAGEKIDVVVPTGNFGNILAGYYAKCMGLPLGVLICASNENKVLYDFFQTGTYDKNREFILTSSPSMDILISSNLERLIFRIAGNDAKKNAELMNSLSKSGVYKIDASMKQELVGFAGGFATEENTADIIKQVYENTGYLLDTHTAVAASVYYENMKNDMYNRKTLIVSTASPYKFTRSVMSAIDKKYDAMDDFALIDELNRLSAMKIPVAIEEIRNAQILHDTVCETSDMQKEVEGILRI